MKARECLALIALISIFLARPAAGGGPGSAAEPIQLDGSLEPFVDYFNGQKERVRFVTLLSPT